jgi:DNA-binding transcriptional ArsR family regulator
LGDPTRLAILLALWHGERRVVDLVQELETSQSNVSGHLACLKECGLVADRPEGRQVFYRIAVLEVQDVLRAAEEISEATGYAIELCPNYGPGMRRPSPTAEPDTNALDQAVDSSSREVVGDIGSN